MLNALLLAASVTSCQAMLTPPSSGSTFVFDGGDFAVFETVGAPQNTGRVDFNLGMARSPEQAATDSMTEYATLAGVVPLGVSFMGQPRHEYTMPQGALAQMQTLTQGDAISFQTTVSATLEGRAYRERGEIEVRLVGCGPVATPAGRFETQRYVVSYPSVGLSNGRFRIEQVDRIVDYAPELGWPVRHDYGAEGSAVLVRIE